MSYLNGMASAIVAHMVDVCVLKGV
jgi:hypothetical protein